MFWRNCFFQVDAEVLQCGESDVRKVNLKALWPIRAAEMELSNYFLWSFTPSTLSTTAVSDVTSSYLPVFLPTFHVASPSMSSVRYISNVTLSYSSLGAILCNEDGVYLIWHFSYLECLGVQIAENSVLCIFFLSIIYILGASVLFRTRKKTCKKQSFLYITNQKSLIWK